MEILEKFSIGFGTQSAFEGTPGAIGLRFQREGLDKCIYAVPLRRRAPHYPAHDSRMFPMTSVETMPIIEIESKGLSLICEK
jgi:hypothetical protein